MNCPYCGYVLDYVYEDRVVCDSCKKVIEPLGNQEEGKEQDGDYTET